MRPLLTSFLIGYQSAVPWYWQHLGAILFGVATLLAARSRVPFHLKNSPEPLSNQRFWRVCFVILGLAMIGFSIWGLWLGR